MLSMVLDVEHVITIHTKKASPAMYARKGVSSPMLLRAQLAHWAAFDAIKLSKEGIK